MNILSQRPLPPFYCPTSFALPGTKIYVSQALLSHATRRVVGDRVFHYVQAEVVSIHKDLTHVKVDMGQGVGVTIAFRTLHVLAPLFRDEFKRTWRAIKSVVCRDDSNFPQDKDIDNMNIFRLMTFTQDVSVLMHKDYPRYHALFASLQSIVLWVMASYALESDGGVAKPTLPDFFDALKAIALTD